MPLFGSPSELMEPSIALVEVYSTRMDSHGRGVSTSRGTEVQAMVHSAAGKRGAREIGAMKREWRTGAPRSKVRLFIAGMVVAYLLEQRGRLRDDTACRDVPYTHCTCTDLARIVLLYGGHVPDRDLPIASSCPLLPVRGPEAL